MKMHAPGILGAALAAALISLAPFGAQAQSFPSRPVRLVVPYGTGGGPDVIARALSQRLPDALGQPVIVDNRPGASGAIGAEVAAKSPPDGHTLFVADNGHWAINPALRPNLSYDILRDFTPVTQLITSPLFLAVPPSLPVKNLQELIALAKTRPGGLSYGSSGIGSPHHLALAQIATLTGANLIHVPYKGVAQSVPALLAGDIAALFAALPSVGPHAKSGKARIIAVNTPRRTQVMREVPTVAESGVPDFNVEIAVGLLAPAGTPPEVVRRLNVEVVKLLNTPDFQERLAPQGIDTAPSTPEQLGELMRADRPRYAKLVKDTGAKAD